MLYHEDDKSFKHQVGASLQKRLKIFLTIASIMVLVVLFDIYRILTIGTTVPLSWIFGFIILALLIGWGIGMITTRIFHLSWDHDGQQVVGRIDKIGAMVLAEYIILEIIRAVSFEKFISNTTLATMLGFVIISSALIGRVIGLRGKILQILKDEKVL